ncbi:diguanylate cyclase [Pseudacidovorax sp. RU35E]|uniref:diguanylate cyclase n=1 Tax=Pseudacidovorax sp. RU35E TaxID=1907403 RepID=UPI000970D138|nr:diguanylate cyclase [Pseudacidovorax sp. RU35E]
MLHARVDTAQREEFACILPGSPHAQALALAVAEQARLAVAALGIAHAHSDVTAHVTASLGVLTLEGAQPHTPDALLRLADGALYRAKREGRNRVVGVTVGGRMPGLPT